jgi:hypothetical protein
MRRLNLEALAFQQQTQRFQHVRLVVRNQNSPVGFHARLRL